MYAKYTQAHIRHHTYARTDIHSNTRNGIDRMVGIAHTYTSGKYSPLWLSSFFVFTNLGCRTHTANASAPYTISTRIAGENVQCVLVSVCITSTEYDGFVLLCVCVYLYLCALAFFLVWLNRRKNVYSRSR